MLFLAAWIGFLSCTRFPGSPLFFSSCFLHGFVNIRLLQSDCISLPCGIFCQLFKDLVILSVRILPFCFSFCAASLTLCIEHPYKVPSLSLACRLTRILSYDLPEALLRLPRHYDNAQLQQCYSEQKKRILIQCATYQNCNYAHDADDPVYDQH